MKNEFLDIVDEYDHIIDCKLRAEAHAAGLRHRAAHILVFNDQGWLFLQKRALKKDLNAGLWDTSAAGHVDCGESYDDCARRELTEELGVKAEVIPLFKLPAHQNWGMEFIQVYRCQHNGPFILAKDEIDEGNWINPKEINKRVTENDISLTDTFKVIWQQYEKLQESE